MDVSISSADKRHRESSFEANMELKMTRDEQKAMRDSRYKDKCSAVIAKRLHRRIEKAVCKNLATEKTLYLTGKEVGGEYLVRVGVFYRFKRRSINNETVEKVMAEMHARHSGFQYQLFFTAYNYAHKQVGVRYKLLEKK
jgi:hypothetical protein